MAVSVKLYVLTPDQRSVGLLIFHARVTQFETVTICHNLADRICIDFPLFFRIFSVPVMLPKVLVRREDRQLKLLGLLKNIDTKEEE